MKRIVVPLGLVIASPTSVFATGLNFWESSTVNTGLAAANGARASDAAVLALAPSSITQLKEPTLTASVTYYEVTTQYDIFGSETEFEQGAPIPAGFFAMPINEHWSVGLAIYSRTAADISLPEMFVIPETRVRPITVSIAPTLAYRWNKVSFGLTLESLQTMYSLEQESVCIIRCSGQRKIEGNTSGWTGELSATWEASSNLAFAASHRFGTDYSNSDIQLNLPEITSVYATWTPVSGLNWHMSYSYTKWQNKGIRYNEYQDMFGLLVGDSDSQRLATSLSYQINNLELRAGVSADEAIDAFGGIDVRYRIGAGYQITPNWKVDTAFMIEDYATKEFQNEGGNRLIYVQNNGLAASIGVTYLF